MFNPPFFDHFIAFNDEQLLDLYVEACRIYLIYRDVVNTSNLMLLWSNGDFVTGMI